MKHPVVYVVTGEKPLQPDGCHEIRYEEPSIPVVGSMVADMLREGFTSIKIKTEKV